MVKVIKEIAERIALVDLLREAREADAFINTLEEEKKFQFNIRYLTRTASRAMLRAAGDISAAVGVYAVSVDSEHLSKYLTAGFAGMLFAYTFDYVVFDRWRPTFKKDDSQSQ